MKKLSVAWPVLSGLFLLFGVVAGYGGGGSGNSVSGDPDGSAELDATDMSLDTRVAICAAANANCGLMSDGQGGVIDCGSCTAPQTCGGGGVLFQCGGCTPTTCVAQGANGGMSGDGCGGTLNCGTCTVAGETCGGGGVAGRCGKQTCTPYTTCMPHDPSHPASLRWDGLGDA